MVAAAANNSQLVSEALGAVHNHSPGTPLGMMPSDRAAMAVQTISGRATQMTNIEAFESGESGKDEEDGMGEFILSPRSMTRSGKPVVRSFFMD